LDLILERTAGSLDAEALAEEVHRVEDYFLTTLVTDEDDIWVNLGIGGVDECTSDALSDTRLGRDLLLSDLAMKQFVSSNLQPDSPSGNRYWSLLHGGVPHELVENEPFRTVTRMTLRPERCVVMAHSSDSDYSNLNSENRGRMAGALALASKIGADKQYGFVVENRLGVASSLDDESLRDWPCPSANQSNEQSAAQRLSQELIDSVIVPGVVAAINEGAVHPLLCQMYQVMVLATWFKIRIKELLAHGQGGAPTVVLDQTLCGRISFDHWSEDGTILTPKTLGRTRQIESPGCLRRQCELVYQEYLQSMLGAPWVASDPATEARLETRSRVYSSGRIEGLSLAAGRVVLFAG
jgi:hypothetical protein